MEHPESIDHMDRELLGIAGQALSAAVRAVTTLPDAALQFHTKASLGKVEINTVLPAGYQLTLTLKRNP